MALRGTLLALLCAMGFAAQGVAQETVTLGTPLSSVVADILATVKRENPWLFSVGFAAETEELDKHARQKLQDKGVEMIVANWVGHAANETDGAFGSDNNALKLFWQGGELELGVSSKVRLARELVALIATQYDNAIQSGKLNAEQRNTENVVQFKSNDKNK